MSEDPVFAKAREIVNRTETEYGFVDVGDVLVSYLRGRIGAAEAVEQIDHLEVDYARARKRGSVAS